MANPRPRGFSSLVIAPPCVEMPKKVYENNVFCLNSALGVSQPSGNAAGSSLDTFAVPGSQAAARQRRPTTDNAPWLQGVTLDFTASPSPSHSASSIPPSPFTDPGTHFSRHEPFSPSSVVPGVNYGRVLGRDDGSVALGEHERLRGVPRYDI
ncbi:hypothetical protein BJ165DRAFT_1572200 [Panaeolus papilionaceus]|nr:hypothetical protein BJ165DRAFT_1572200 [Panaeolus papilionaceus]